MSDDHPERIATLEAQMLAIQADISEMKPMVKETHKRITQWGGVVTGIALTVTTIWAGVLALYHVLTDWLR